MGDQWGINGGQIPILSPANVANYGWTLQWDCGAYLDSDRLLEMGLEQSGLHENVNFRRWQDTHQLSLTDAAQAIGLSRRTVSQYRAGARPVPRTIALACLGWEVVQKVQKSADHKSSCLSNSNK